MQNPTVKIKIEADLLFLLGSAQTLKQPALRARSIATTLFSKQHTYTEGL